MNAFVKHVDEAKSQTSLPIQLVHLKNTSYSMTDVNSGILYGNGSVLLPFPEEGIGFHQLSQVKSIHMTKKANQVHIFFDRLKLDKSYSSLGTLLSFDHWLRVLLDFQRAFFAAC